MPVIPSQANAVARAVVYLRVSTEEQARKGVSLDAQEAACLRYCADRNISVVAILRDEGQSTATPLVKRPEGKKLAQHLADGDAQHVIAHSQSRLFRNTPEALQVARAWGSIGVSLHLLDRGGEVDVASADGEFIYTVNAAMDARERSKLRERVREAMAHIADTGRLPAGVVLGYDRDANKALVVNEREAAIVRELFARAAEGEPLTRLAAWLNAQDCPRKKGGSARLGEGAVKRILTNPIYVGRFRWRGEEHDGTHEPLVDAATWQAVQEKARLRSQSHGRRANHLTPLFKCGVCGSRTCCAVSPRTYADGTPYDLVSIYCWERLQDRHAHERVTCTEHKASMILWGYVRDLLGGADLPKALREARAALSNGDHKQAKRDARLAELARLRRVNVEALHAGAITLADLQSLNAPLLAEEETLLREAADGDGAGPLLDALDELAQLDAGAWVAQARELPVEDQLAALSAIMDRVELLPGVLRVHHVGDILPPVDLPIPRYYAPRRRQQEAARRGED